MRTNAKARTPRFEEFPIPERRTVSGASAGDICFSCECRVVEIGGEANLTLAWCECGFPDDHHEMELL